MEHDLVGDAEDHWPSTEQVEPTRRADAGEARGDRVDIRLVRKLAFEAEHAGDVAPVSLAGVSERSIELDDDALYTVERTVLLEGLRKPTGGLHGTDRV